MIIEINNYQNIERFNANKCNKLSYHDNKWKQLTELTEAEHGSNDTDWPSFVENYINHM